MGLCHEDFAAAAAANCCVCVCCCCCLLCAAIQPGQPLELVEPEGPVSDDFTVVVAGSGTNGDVLRQRAADGGSRPGGMDGTKSWVLASGGFEEVDNAN